MSAVIPKEFPIDLCRIIYNYVYGYNPDIHTPTALARAGNLAGITWIFNHGKWSAADLQVALVAAAESGHLDLVIFLIDAGAAVKHIVDPSLLAASFNGNLSVVQFLVQKGAGNIFALPKAAGEGHLDIVEYFIQENMRTGFISACENSILGGHLNVITFLMSTIDDPDYQWRPQVAIWK